jgi:hypothetical protein
MDSIIFDTKVANALQDIFDLIDDVYYEAKSNKVKYQFSSTLKDGMDFYGIYFNDSANQCTIFLGFYLDFYKRYGFPIALGIENTTEPLFWKFEEI